MSEKHYTVRVTGTTHITESRDLDVEFKVPSTVKLENLLDYIKEQVEAEDLRNERDSYSLSPTASYESSVHGIESHDHESYEEIYWEEDWEGEGGKMIVDGEYLEKED